MPDSDHLYNGTRRREIRELQNLIERAVILSNYGVLPNLLPAAGTQTVAVSPAQTTFRDSERAVILHTLEATSWVIGGSNGADAKLGLKRTTLIFKMQKLGICRPVLQNSADLREAAHGSWRLYCSSTDRHPESETTTI